MNAREMPGNCQGNEAFSGRNEQCFSELVHSCLTSPSCMQAHGQRNELRDAIARQDQDAVCRILPARIHCVQLAVNACRNQDLSRRDRVGEDEQTIQRAINRAEEMQRRFEQMCPGYSVDNPSNSGPAGLSSKPNLEGRVGGTVDSESALISAGPFCRWFEPRHRRSGLAEGPESMRSPCCGLAMHEN
ncbi:hypothetical protein PoB_002526100 [Plakobranchus ocellatus]|uniref:Uncharacterized protein n=1 Tax=Plakobranchus ocellatus TaxID=259542 RepID=A0AAV3ZW47_9GAST|nr:hypothetical protein PoB_002526100 [Plakobranchus ocellatus]